MPHANSLLSNVTSLIRHFQEYDGGDRCLVAPSPELRDQIKNELNTLRAATATSLVGNFLRVKPAVPIGMNDGLIRPGPTFPLGTAAMTIQRAAADRAPLRGETRVIVVLVDFEDKAMSFSKQHFEELFFSTGVLPNGSVKEYFQEVTDGLVDIAGEVVGPLRLPKTLQAYANGASGTGTMEPNARTMAKDAAVKADPTIDFSRYDNDGDGFVDAFVIVHAGLGGETTGSVNDIWSHKWVLTNGAYNADGTQVFAYLTVPENAKIGVCCHELGHLLFGFPDLYDTDYSSEGVGNWCLMGGGSWLGGGEKPGHPSAWCKVQQGWVEVEEPDNGLLQIPDVKTGKKVFRLWKNKGGGDEYFLVENRQKAGYDEKLPGEGLLVWHVDDSIPNNSNEIHPRVALVQADGKDDLRNGNNRGDAGDPFPGSSDNRLFDGSSNPDSNSYNDLDTCVRIELASGAGPVMTAMVQTVCPGQVPDPKTDPGTGTPGTQPGTQNEGCLVAAARAVTGIFRRP